MTIPGPVLVTGGSRGLGRAIVERLVSLQVPVAFTYNRGADAAQQLVDRLEGRAHAFSFALEDRERPVALIAEVEAQVGPLFGLVNNAAIRRDNLLALTSDAEWSATIDANLDAAFRLTRAALRSLVPQRRGSIVNIASLTAIHGVAGQAAYGASKAALLGLTRSLAREIGKRQLRVNAIVPGFVMTEMTAALAADTIKTLRAAECLPSGVLPEHVAGAVCFFLSDASAGITGQTLVVDAGTSA